MWRTSSARRKLLPSTTRVPGPRLILVRPVARVLVLAMELFTRLFGHLLAFVYHCFDRIVIHGYLTGLSRPEHVVYFFREVTGAPVITKEILASGPASTRTGLRPSPAIIASPSNGPRRACARRILSAAGNAASCATMPTACILFSKAWR